MKYRGTCYGGSADGKSYEMPSPFLRVPNRRPLPTPCDTPISTVEAVPMDVSEYDFYPEHKDGMTLEGRWVYRPSSPDRA